VKACGKGWWRFHINVLRVMLKDSIILKPSLPHWMNSMLNMWVVLKGLSNPI